MPLQSIERILNHSMGLDVGSIGAPALARAVRARMSIRQLGQTAAYLEQVRSSPQELQALVETIVVSETWFFRDREAFIAVAAMAAKTWLVNPAKPAMRLLSAPCSTGEEPYSMAMSLLDAGLAADRFSIDALDISAQTLARANAGIYGKNSFRGDDLGFRASHFTPIPAGFRISDAARASIRFRQANLLAMEAGGPANGYDVVFCRNLLIYFDLMTQRRAIEILRRLVTPDGLLFVGPGEANLLLAAGFASARIPLAFAFSKTGATPIGQEPAPRPRRPALATAPAAAPQGRAAFATARASLASAAVATKYPGVAEARQLADQGRLIDAAKACEDHLRHEPSSIEAWRLLGVLRDASGESAGAADCYRKALYLDPVDRETLEHLALLLERQGDAAGARLVSARALRLQRRS